MATQKLWFLDARARILNDAGEPVRSGVLTARALAADPIETSGNTPAATMNTLLVLGTSDTATRKVGTDCPEHLRASGLGEEGLGSRRLPTTIAAGEVLLGPDGGTTDLDERAARKVHRELRLDALHGVAAVESDGEGNGFPQVENDAIEEQPHRPLRNQVVVARRRRCQHGHRTGGQVLALRLQVCPEGFAVPQVGCDGGEEHPGHEPRDDLRRGQVKSALKGRFWLTQPGSVDPVDVTALHGLHSALACLARL